MCTKMPSTIGRPHQYAGFEDDEPEKEPYAEEQPQSPQSSIKSDASPTESLGGRVRRYVLFAVFGSGSSWISVNALYLEIAIYQSRFGLTTSNRMAIGYDLGCLTVPLFFILRCWYQRSHRALPYRGLIVAINLLQLLTLVWSAKGVNSLEELVVVNFLGGSCGYLSALVHQSYLLMHYHNAYASIFEAGDAAAGVFSALLALLQQPALEESERRFGTRVFFSANAVLVPLSLVAFLIIEKTGEGALDNHRVEEAAAGAANASGATEDAGVDQDRLGPPDAAGCPEAAPAAPPPRGACCRASRWARCLPAAARMHWMTTLLLGVVVLWSQLANWGIMDSLAPYACAKASPSDEGNQCAEQVSYGTIFGGLVGTNLAAAMAWVDMNSLILPFFLYCVPFPVLCMAALRGGAWASVWPSERSSGSYVAFMVTVMRLFGPMSRSLVTRLVQVKYEPKFVESMNVFYETMGTAANFVGIIGMTWFLTCHDPAAGSR